MNTDDEYKCVNKFFLDRYADAAIMTMETETEILNFVKGLRRKRINPVTKKQIESHLVKSHLAKIPMFKKINIDNAINSLITEKKIRIVMMNLSSYRRENGAFRYYANK